MNPQFSRTPLLHLVITINERLVAFNKSDALSIRLVMEFTELLTSDANTETDVGFAYATILLRSVEAGEPTQEEFPF